MAKVTSYARQLRYELQAKLGREVTIEEVAAETGIERRKIMAIERNEVERISRRNIETLADFYIGKGLDGGRVMVVEVPQKNRAPRLDQVPLPV